MRMAELSRTSGVPVATIKFYLREGLLPRGETAGSPNQASYGDAHLRRLALVRSLVEIGGLSVSAVRRVLEVIEDPAVPLHDALGPTLEHTVRHTPDTTDPEHAEAERRIDALIAEQGWQLSPDTPARRAAIEAWASMRRLGGDRFDPLPEVYARTVGPVAEADIATVVAVPERADRVETALVGTVLGEQLLAALRRLAHEHLSSTHLT